MSLRQAGPLYSSPWDGWILFIMVLVTESEMCLHAQFDQSFGVGDYIYGIIC